MSTEQAVDQNFVLRTFCDAIISSRHGSRINGDRFGKNERRKGVLNTLKSSSLGF